MVAAALPALARSQADELLDQAIRFADGARVLKRARVLAWTGEARIHTGGRTTDIHIHIEAVVTPSTA